MRNHTRNTRLIRLIKRGVAGAAAGFAATIPMSAVMLLWHRRLPWNHRDSLPPRQITENMLYATGICDDLTKTQELALTVANHFAYGAALGAGYGCVAPRLPLPAPLITGIVYGTSVWAGSYLGWLPAAGLYRSATKESSDRNAMMLTAHVVWGGTLGLLAPWFEKRNTPSEQSAGVHVEQQQSREADHSEVIAE